MRALAGILAVVLWVGGCSSDSPPPPRTSVRTVGEACASDSVCSLGTSCATAMPGGMCTYSCSGDPCPSNAVCADMRASGSGILCAPKCTAPADCRSGYTCCAGLGACVPAANCPPQQRPASPDLGMACGAGCTGAGEICVGDPNPEFPGGACTAACNPGDQTTCPTNGKCVSTSTGSFCFPSCTGPGNCSAPLTSCVGGACRSPTGSPACSPLPPGTPNVVLGGTAGPATAPAACDPAHAAAVGTPVLPAKTFGVHPVGDVVSFTVPAGTGSWSILSQGSNVPVSTVTLSPATVIPNSVVPTQVTTPSNAMIFDDIPPPVADGSNNPIFYAGNSPFTGMMTFPNTSLSLQQSAVAGGVQPGTWSFQVNDFALECTSPRVSNCSPKTPPGTSYDIRVLFKPGLPPATGTVDVAFYFLGGYLIAGNPATAATAKNDPAFNRMLQTLGTFYANAGLCLGTVTLYDVPAWAKMKWPGFVNADDETACSDLSQIFTLSAPGNQINFFFVSGFKASTGQGLSVVGVDGTIPGPSGLGGNVSSGASVNGSDLTLGLGCSTNIDIINCGADEVAYIVAHEGGHFMGLYHTTEQTGDSFDPLSDTPTCQCTSCAPSNQRSSCASNNPSGTPTLVKNESCLSPPSCGGGDNLMFWLLSSSSKGALSPHQGQVIRSNLVVR